MSTDQRALSAGRGLSASPLRAGWPLWRRLLYRTYCELTEDRLLALAAGVVFYALLAIFPALTALVSCYALFSDPLTISDHLAMLAAVMPHDAYGIVQQQLARITSNTTGAVSLAFFVSLSLAIWSANAGMKAIIDALNVVYEVKERRNIIRLNLVSLSMTLCAIAGFLLAIGAVIVVPILLAALPFADGLPAVAWLRWPVVALLLMLGLSALYYFGPDRDRPRWRWLETGNVIAVTAWLGGSLLLSWYLGNVANYGAAYGPFGAVIGLMFWLWLTATVILVGAELNSEIDAARTPSRNAPRDKIGGVN